MESIETPLKEFVSIIKDKQWHEVYEFHQTYHLSPVEIFRVIDVLLKNSIINKVGYNIRIVDNLTNSQMAFLNRIQKTRRPLVLDLYEPNHLTRRGNRV